MKQLNTSRVFFRYGLIGSWAAISLSLMFLAQNQAQAHPLSTRSGEVFGFELNSYKYEEPGLMQLKATKFGVDYAVTRAFDEEWPQVHNRWFVSGEFKFATGKARYSNLYGDTATGLPDWYGEARALVGKDLLWGNTMVSPYVGLGYRFLHNDLRAFSNGYRRNSQYLSLPLGVSIRLQDLADSPVTIRAEWIHLIKGTQSSMLSDFNASREDVHLQQPRGYGLRLSVMKQVGQWSIGPTVNYWRIDDSEVGGRPAIYEPKNKTIEFGLRVVYAIN